jgi:hypothetical protein
MGNIGVVAFVPASRMLKDMAAITPWAMFTAEVPLLGVEKLSVAESEVIGSLDGWLYGDSLKTRARAIAA